MPSRSAQSLWTRPAELPNQPLHGTAKEAAPNQRRSLRQKEEAKDPETPIIVERVEGDIDEIVRYVRFDRWQNTHAGEREVKTVLRKSLFKHRLHQDQELFDQAYWHIREYY